MFSHLEAKLVYCIFLHFIVSISLSVLVDGNSDAKDLEQMLLVFHFCVDSSALFQHRCKLSYKLALSNGLNLKRKLQFPQCIIPGPSFCLDNLEVSSGTGKPNTSRYPQLTSSKGLNGFCGDLQPAIRIEMQQSQRGFSMLAPVAPLQCRHNP